MERRAAPLAGTSLSYRCGLGAAARRGWRKARQAAPAVQAGGGRRGALVWCPTPAPHRTAPHCTAPPRPVRRQRESTQYRGVTKTSGTNSGVEKFDVQFVFCDNGTKKHPKVRRAGAGQGGRSRLPASP